MPYAIFFLNKKCLTKYHTATVDPPQHVNKYCTQYSELYYLIYRLFSARKTNRFLVQYTSLGGLTHLRPGKLFFEFVVGTFIERFPLGANEQN
jgi:hypothetical protein